ncbi:MAG TPA: HNH endonuclease [Mycobacteriales bacterium]|nr:HNH endonuclease [Mycobacteriales bacterium]
MIKKCSVDGCERDAKERGWCHGHYQRWKRLGHVQAERPLGRKTQGTCKIGTCERTIYARGLCAPHYRRQMAGGDVRAEQPIRPPAGDRHISHGYYVVNVPPEMRYLTGGDSQALEHRFVMAQLLNRPLWPDESVHHRSGDRLDNRPENLELWSRWQPRGQRVADKIAFAVELLRRYAPDLLSK